MTRSIYVILNMYLVLHTSFLKPLLDDFPSRAIQRVFSKVLVISIPKTGTNLMGKLCLSFGFSHHNFSKKTATHISNNELKNMPSKHYSGLHIVAISEHFDALAHLEYNNIFMYRDPRDQIVSAAYYMKASGDRWICGGWPLKKIISHLIVDCSLWCSLPGKSPWHGELLKKVGTIKDFYDLYLGWMNFPGIYVTTFEKLVGTKGGGDDMVQYQEIQNISKHCSLFLDNADILAIQKNLFGGTGTFRHGIIGEWRTHFTEDDKAIFKQVAGQLLIDLGYEKDFNW